PQCDVRLIAETVNPTDSVDDAALDKAESVPMSPLEALPEVPVAAVERVRVKADLHYLRRIYQRTRISEMAIGYGARGSHDITARFSENIYGDRRAVDRGRRVCGGKRYDPDRCDRLRRSRYRSRQTGHVCGQRRAPGGLGRHVA